MEPNTSSKLGKYSTSIVSSLLAVVSLREALSDLSDDLKRALSQNKVEA